MENIKYPNIEYNYSGYSGYPVYVEYFKDVKTMADLAKRIKEIPDSVLDILCHEVSMAHNICRSPDESCIRYIIENSEDDKIVEDSYNVKQCSNCGVKIGNDDVFCYNCGRKQV